MPTNCNDMTFAEWIAASTCEGKVDLKILRRAWSKGEDPCDWRAAHSN